MTIRTQARRHSIRFPPADQILLEQDDSCLAADAIGRSVNNHFHDACLAGL